MTDHPTAQRAPAGSPTPDSTYGTTDVTGTAPVPVSAPVFSTSAVVASCVGFMLIGALQAFYGPAIPALRAEFGLSPSVAGLGLSAHFVGGVAGVLLFDRLYGRTGNRRILAASYLLMAVGSAGFAIAPNWPSPSPPRSWRGSASAVSTTASTNSSRSASATVPPRCSTSSTPTSASARSSARS